MGKHYSFGDEWCDCSKSLTKLPIQVEVNLVNDIYIKETDECIQCSLQIVCIKMTDCTVIEIALSKDNWLQLFLLAADVAKLGEEEYLGDLINKKKMMSLLMTKLIEFITDECTLGLNDDIGDDCLEINYRLVMTSIEKGLLGNGGIA
jgi:hypothetical protein